MTKEKIIVFGKQFFMFYLVLLGIILKKNDFKNIYFKKQGVQNIYIYRYRYIIYIFYIYEYLLIYIYEFLVIFIYILYIILLVQIYRF